MAMRSYVPLIGYEQQLRDWLKLGDHRHPDDPSLHDLLDLDESCLDRRQIEVCSTHRAGILRGLESGIRDPVALSLLSRLERYISSAERLLCDPKGSGEYFYELSEHRAAQFVMELKRHWGPGDTISGQVRNDLITLGEDRFRLAKAAVERILAYFFQELPEERRDLVRWLGIAVFREDPTWPTHFDVLGLPEAQPAGAKVVQKARDDQVAKLTTLLRHQELKKRRQAEAVRQQVESAAKEISASVSSYMETCRKERISAFTNMVKEHKQLRGELTTDGRARLLLEAGRLRLPEADALPVIDGVFPPAAERRQPRARAAAGGSGTTGSGATVQPQVRRPTLDRYGSAAALIGAVALLSTFFSQLVAPDETPPLVLGIAGGCASLIGLGMLGRLWGENWLDLKGLLGVYAKLLVVVGLLVLANYLVGNGIAGILGLLSTPLAPALTTAVFGAAAGLFTAMFVLGDPYGEDSAVMTRTLVPACAGGFFLADIFPAALLPRPYVLPVLVTAALTVSCGWILRKGTAIPHPRATKLVSWAGTPLVVGTAALALALPMPAGEPSQPADSPFLRDSSAVPREDLSASHWEGAWSTESKSKHHRVVLEIANERNGRIEGTETFPELQSAVRIVGSVSQDGTNLEFTAVEAIRGNRVTLPCKHTAQLTAAEMLGTWASALGRGEFRLARVQPPDGSQSVECDPVDPQPPPDPKPPRLVEPEPSEPVEPEPSEPVKPEPPKPKPHQGVKPKPPQPEPYRPQQEGKVLDVDESAVTETYVTISLGERDGLTRGAKIQIELSKEPMPGGGYFRQEATVTEVSLEDARARLSFPRLGLVTRGDKVSRKGSARPDPSDRFPARYGPRGPRH